MFGSNSRMDCWRSNAPRVESDLTSLIISSGARPRGAPDEIYGVCRAALVRGAFAIQCRNPVLLGWLTLLTAPSACSHFSPPYGLTGTGDRSDLAIKSLNDLCCRRTIHRWNWLAKTLQLMCRSVGTEEVFLIHPCISSKCTVCARPVRRLVCRISDNWYNIVLNAV